jgi:membrane-associated phospholipid phosphatase
VATAAAAAFATLAGLVAAGTLTGLDQWAVDHAMPGAKGVGPSPGLLESVVPLLHADYRTPLLAAAEIVTLPAQAVLSFVVVGAVGVVLHRRGRTDAAVLWLAALVLATAVEVAAKHSLERPPLYRDGVHIVAFDSSWPSGHAARAAIIAGALAVAWPRLRGALALWLVAAVALLELAGIHTPTDLAGGLLLAFVFGVCALEVERSGALRRGALARLDGGRPSPSPRRP